MLDIMEAASKGNDIRGLISGEMYSDISEAVESALAVSADEVCRQMAYHAARDFTNFDPIKMTYSKYSLITTAAAFLLLPLLFDVHRHDIYRAYNGVQDCKHEVKFEHVHLARHAGPYTCIHIYIYRLATQR
jgi:hypothetical protein